MPLGGAAGRLPLVRLGHLFLPRLSPLSYTDLSSSFLNFFVNSINANEEFSRGQKIMTFYCLFLFSEWAILQPLHRSIHAA
jgi:hypothetical protein